MLIVLDMSSGEAVYEFCCQDEAPFDPREAITHLPRVDVQEALPAAVRRPIPRIENIDSFLDAMADFH